jgi:ceramide synthetase
MEKKEEKESGKKIMTAKEKYDNVWNHFFYACFGLTLVGIFYMVKGVNNFRNKLISLNPSYEFSKYSDFLICIPLALIINMTQHYMPKLLKNFVEKVMKKSYRFPKNEKDRQLGEKYRIRLPIHIFKGSMYIFFTLFGYYVLKDINYFPKSLLGKGWLPNMFIKGYPDSFYLEKPPYFDFYYMFCLSFFISDLIGLFREDKQTDFINMLLHHVCTISLIVFSHLVHYSNVGSIVLFLHMESDVFVHVTRFFLQTDAPEIIKDINGLFLVFNFIYTRTYVLGDIIYVLYMYVTWKGIIDWFLLIFLTLIFIMNFNWALMLLQKMFALFMGTKLNDTRDFKVNTNKEKEKKVE